MAYYRIEFLTREANKGWYTHLPVCYQVTTDLKQASEWFDLAVKNLSRQYGNTFESVDRDMKKTIMGTIKMACFSCKMTGYRHGDYLLELREYSFNPFED